MKLVIWTIGLVFAGAVVALSGCSKSDKAPAGVEVQAIDATKLRPAFSSASAELQASVNKVMLAIQGSDFTTALMELDKLANDPNVSDQQKKVVNDLIEQLKKKLAATSPPA